MLKVHKEPSGRSTRTMTFQPQSLVLSILMSSFIDFSISLVTLGFKQENLRNLPHLFFRIV